VNPRRRRLARQRRKRRDLHLEIDGYAGRLLASLEAMVRPTWQSIKLEPGDEGDTVEVVPLAYAPAVRCKVGVEPKPAPSWKGRK
jgi:hypothetical protein